jgi:hypothetical protein
MSGAFRQLNPGMGGGNPNSGVNRMSGASIDMGMPDHLRRIPVDYLRGNPVTGMVRMGGAGIRNPYAGMVGMGGAGIRRLF